MKNFVFNESGVTVVEEPYMVEHLEASKAMGFTGLLSIVSKASFVMATT